MGKSIQSTRQSASETPFNTPMLAISHLASLGFKRETNENLWKAEDNYFINFAVLVDTFVSNKELI